MNKERAKSHYIRYLPQASWNWDLTRIVRLWGPLLDPEYSLGIVLNPIMSLSPRRTPLCYSKANILVLISWAKLFFICRIFSLSFV